MDKIGALPLFEFFMAIRYLGAKSQERFISLISLLSFLGIFLGVAILIIVASVFNGFRSELLNLYVGDGGHITIYGMERQVSESENYIHALKELEGIERIRPAIDSYALMIHNVNSSPSMIQAYKPEDIHHIPSLEGQVSAEIIDQLSEKTGDEQYPHIILGQGLAFDLGIFEPSSIVTIMSSQLTETPFGSSFSSTDYLVTGIIQSSDMRYNQAAIMDLDQAAWFLGTDNHPSRLDIFLDDINQVDEMRTQIEQLNLELGRHDLYIQSWREQYGQYVAAIDVERNIFILIISLVVVIAAFNIISSLIMLVRSKVRDIGILRTQGATQKQIRNIFLLTGSLIGIVGAIFGSLFGVIFAHNAENIRLFINETFGLDLFPMSVFQMSALPSEVNYIFVFFTFIFAVFLTILASLYPAHKASKIDPAEALKHD